MKTLIPAHPAALASVTITTFTACRARMLAVLAVSAALATPLASHAVEATAFHQTPIDACVTAFVAANLPHDQPVRIRKDTLTLSPLDAFGRAYLISMAAVGAQSGKRYGKATCRVTRSGQVLALDGRPLSHYVVKQAPPAADQTAAR